MEIAVISFLVLLATVLLVVEVVFIPGFGFTGIMGIASMIGAVAYAFFEVGNVAGWVTLLVSALICIALFFWALYGSSLDKVALKKNINSTVQVVDVKDFKVGDRGVARTRLALIGEALIKGEVVEVKSEGGFINEREEIEIIRISGDSIFVEKVNDCK
jgi:membrane-bound ClpP family serine protease